MSNPVSDVLVIGGGAAGLMAAASASQRGRRVVLLEKNRKLGVKILMSGGTRCNITHDCGPREIISAFGQQGRFLRAALGHLPPHEVVRLIESRGVATKVESTGKVFPQSDRALDVRDALVGLARDAGAELVTEQGVIELRRLPGAAPANFEISTAGRLWHAQRVILTTGGRSYPGCGTTGDGYAWAQSFGHSIERTVPALVPILSDCAWSQALKGIAIDPVQVALRPKPGASAGKNKPLDVRRGSLLFTHWGFSGPAALDLSRQIALAERPTELELVCDLLPELSHPQFQAELESARQQHPRQTIANRLSQWFPKRVAESLVQAAGLPTELRGADLSKRQLHATLEIIKQCKFPVRGTLGFEKAEVTAGGVARSEIDPKTMQSLKCEGLYLAGEILDLDGPIGGFNFQAAFSTGWLAGLAAADSLAAD